MGQLFIYLYISPLLISLLLISPAELLASPHYPLIYLYQSLCPFSITTHPRVSSSSHAFIFFPSIHNLFFGLTSFCAGYASSLLCPLSSWQHELSEGTDGRSAQEG
jgi:hypothetical protein